MRTLVYCPAGPAGYGWQESIRSIRALRGAEKVVIRRSRSPGDKHADVLANYQYARQMLLAGDYDALLTVESDVIVPPDALELLSAAMTEGVGVVYGLYCLRGSNTHEWNLHRPDRPGGRFPMSHSFSKKGHAPHFWGGVHEVGGVGLGCTLIRRFVLERLDFRHDPTNPAMYCDYYLALDAFQAGIRQRGHCGVVCGHIRHDEQDVLWPAPTDSGYELRPLLRRGRY